MKRTIKNLQLKIKLLKEYLKDEGYKRITDPGLLAEIEFMKYGKDGNPDPSTIGTRANAFMMGLVHLETKAPNTDQEALNEYRSLLQKSSSFEQIEINNEKDFEIVYNEYFNKPKLIFRGQREASWRLYNSLQRYWIQKKLFVKEENYQKLLEKIVANGRNDHGEEIQKLLNKYNIDTVNDTAVLSYLQHHGCPTPLLDWTFNLDNALFFGIDGLIKTKENRKDIDNYFSVYYIEEEYFEEGSMRKIINHGMDTAAEEIRTALREVSKEDGLDLKKLEDIFTHHPIFDIRKYEGTGLISHMTDIKRMINIPLTYFSDNNVESGVIFSLNNSRNILNQKGVFTWNSHPFNPIETIGYEQFQLTKSEDELEDYRFCFCFNIHKDLHEYISYKLQEKGITKEFIYPNSTTNTWGSFEKSLTP
jgi:hypothetical protein